MLNNESISTDRLLLRPVVPDDGAAIHAAMTWEVARWLASVPWPNRLEDSAAFAERAGAANAAGKAAIYAIERGGAFGGVISLLPKNGALYLGYWLGERFWGGGLMSEAGQAFIDAFFARNEVVHVISGALENNAPSLRVQEKLGFVVVGETPVFSRPQQRVLPSFDTILGRERHIRSIAA